MAELKLNIVVDNINKLKQQLEKIKIGSKEDKKSGGSSAFSIGASVALLTELVKNTESIQVILKIIGSLVDRLVSPFVPILLTIIKPVFLLLELFLSKVLQSLGVGGGEGSDISNFEKVTKIVLAAIAAIGVAIIAAVAGLPSLVAIGLGLLVAALVVLAVDFGKQLVIWLLMFREKLIEFTTFLRSKLIDFVLYLWESILGIRKFLINMFISSFNKLIEVFDTVWTWLKNIFKSAWDSLINIFNTVWTWLKNAFVNVVNGFISIANFFIKGFAKAINGIITFLNKIPGVNIATRVSANTIEPLKTTQTNININIEGSADEKTVENVIARLRAELARRSSF